MIDSQNKSVEFLFLFHSGFISSAFLISKTTSSRPPGDRSFSLRPIAPSFLSLLEWNSFQQQEFHHTPSWKKNPRILSASRSPPRRPGGDASSRLHSSRMKRESFEAQRSRRCFREADLDLKIIKRHFYCLFLSLHFFWGGALTV